MAAALARRHIHGNRSGSDPCGRPLAAIPVPVDMDGLAVGAFLQGVAVAVAACLGGGDVDVWLVGPHVLTHSASTGELGEPQVLDPTQREVLPAASMMGGVWLREWFPGLAHGRDPWAVPASFAGHPLALLVVSNCPTLDSASAADLLDLGRRLGVSLHVARAAADASAGVAAIRDDLHDGLQQRLVAIAIRLSLLQGSLEEVPSAEVGVCRRMVLDAVEEVRILSHGGAPTDLARGLGPALLTAARRMPGRIRAEVLVPHRYPPLVEETIYFCCMEALANALKHGGPEVSIVMTVRVVADRIEFSVADTRPSSPPVPEDLAAGALLDIREDSAIGRRLAALGGHAIGRRLSHRGHEVLGWIPIST